MKAQYAKLHTLYPKNSSGNTSRDEIAWSRLIISIALPVFFLSDAVNKVVNYNSEHLLEVPFFSFSIFTRSFFEICFLALIIYFLNKQKAVFIFVLGTLFLFFLSANYFISQKTHINISENIVSFNKYFFVFICFFISKAFIQSKNTSVHSVLFLLDTLFILGSLAAIAGFIFDIPYFKTYDQGIRFGYNGLIPAQNESTLFFFISTAYFFFKVCVQKRYHESWKLFIALFTCALVGTKGCLLIAGVTFITYYLFYASLKLKIIVGSGTLLAIPAAGYFILTNMIQNKTTGIFLDAMNKRGLWSTLLSGRDLLFRKKFLSAMNNWEPLNYLFGGQNMNDYLIEMDFFDIFLFLGIFGSLIYLSFLFVYLFRFDYKSPFTYYFVGTYLFIAFFGGHFFMSALNGLYLAIVCLYFQRHTISTKNSTATAD